MVEQFSLFNEDDRHVGAKGVVMRVVNMMLATDTEFKGKNFAYDKVKSLSTVYPYTWDNIKFHVNLTSNR